MDAWNDLDAPTTFSKDILSELRWPGTAAHLQQCASIEDKLALRPLPDLPKLQVRHSYLFGVYSYCHAR